MLRRQTELLKLLTLWTINKTLMFRNIFKEQNKNIEETEIMIEKRTEVKEEKPKVCVITLTYNRPEYIERSFESLYKRAGCKFEHFVFDDHSDEETQEKLQILKKKYGFNLFVNGTRMEIYKSFYWNLRYIPLDYDYYVKLDSDIELLSDDLFVEMIENFKYPEKIGGITIRAEGVRNTDRYDSVMQFYGGHAIKNEAPIVYGCCMMFPNVMFKTFKRLEEKELERTVEKWGIDSILLDHAKKIGKFLIIEDLSVYHIDNTYGQRKHNDCYFTDRKRWSIIDNDEVWYMKASKSIYPKFLNRSMFDKVRKYSANFEEFLENCLIFVKDETKFEEKLVEKQKEEIIQTRKQPIYMKTMYRVTSPMNFRPDPNMKHGEVKLFAEAPLWAKNNPRVVIEKIEVKDEEIEKQNFLEKEIENVEKTETIDEPKEKMLRRCKKCDFTTTSLRRLKSHHEKKHD